MKYATVGMVAKCTLMAMNNASISRAVVKSLHLKKTKMSKKMFGIYIKSHDEAPDYEREVEAESKEEAARLFMTPLMAEAGYDPDMLLDYIEEL